MENTYKTLDRSNRVAHRALERVKVCPQCKTMQHVTSPDVVARGCSICTYPVAKQGGQS